MNRKFALIAGVALLAPALLLSHAALGQIESRPRGVVALTQAQPADLGAMQRQITQVVEENRKLRAELTALKSCFDNHHHWLVGTDLTVSTPTKTGKAPGFVPIDKAC